MIRHLVFQAEPAKPAVRQVQMHFLAELALRADAEAVADHQHPDQKRRINRWTSGVAVVRRKVLVQLAQIEKAVDASEQVIGGDVDVEIEAIEQRGLRNFLASHHRDALDLRWRLRPRRPRHVPQWRSFSTESTRSRQSRCLNCLRPLIVESNAPPIHQPPVKNRMTLPVARSTARRPRSHHERLARSAETCRATCFRITASVWLGENAVSHSTAPSVIKKCE